MRENTDHNIGDGPFKNSLERFEQMLRNDHPSFFEMPELVELIDYYFDLDDLLKAYKAADLATEQYPFSVDFVIKKAQILSAKERFRDALDILHSAELLDPSNSEIHLTKGSIYSQMGAVKESIKAYNNAIKYSDEPDEVYLCIAF